MILKCYSIFCVFKIFSDENVLKNKNKEEKRAYQAERNDSKALGQKHA